VGAGVGVGAGTGICSRDSCCIMMITGAKIIV